MKNDTEGKVRINEPHITQEHGKCRHVKCPNCGSTMFGVERNKDAEVVGLRCLWCEKVLVQE